MFGVTIRFTAWAVVIVPVVQGAVGVVPCKVPQRNISDHTFAVLEQLDEIHIFGLEEA